jgi:diguanylate cyclase (GGDEF)-like protein
LQANLIPGLPLRGFILDPGRRRAAAGSTWSLILLLLTWSTSPVPAQEYAFHNDSRAKGLRNFGVNAMAEDASGYLWVGTYDGLYRYDGSRYERVHTVEGEKDDPQITSLREDAAGHLWMTTLHSVLYLDAAGVHPLNSSREQFDIDPRSSLIAAPDASGGVNFLSAHKLYAVRSPDNGKTWRIAPAFDAATIRQTPLLGELVGGYGTADGHLWLGCGDRVCEAAGGGVRLFAEAGGIPSDRWRSFTVTRSGMVYARGDHHVAALAPDRNRFELLDRGMTPGALGTRASVIAEDPQGRVLTNINGGLARLENGSWRMLTAKNGIPDGEIQSLLFDRAGALMLGANSHGVERWLGYNIWESWTTRSGLASNQMWAIYRDRQKTLWVANELGVQRFVTDSAGVRLEREPGLRMARQSQTIAETSDGRLWIGSDDGTVIEYNPKSGVARIAARVHGVFHLLADRSDRLWVASLSGLFFLDTRDSRQELHAVSAAAIPPGNAYFTLQDQRGVLWFTTAHGIYRFDGATWSRAAIPGEEEVPFSAELAGEPDGSIWAPTLSGALIRWKMVNGAVEVLDRVDLSRRISARIYLVQIDRRGWLWVGTDQGIAVFNGSEWRVFTEDDGLIWNDTDSGAFYADLDGSVWIGCSGGLSHILHPEALFDHRPLEIRLSEIQLGSRQLAAGSEDTRLPWGHDTLSFHIAVKDLERADAVKFRYFLHGLDESWVEARGNDVRYPPLAAGSYELEVGAADPSRNAEAPPVRVAFEILPPWWQTRAFHAGAALLFLLLCVGAWRWSSRMLLARKRQLEILVQNRTSELESEKAALLQARASLVEQATHDFLTGLLNRGAIFSALSHEIERARREGLSFPVVLADIDHFKRINDGHGHLAGDQVLREVGRRFKASLRTYDRTGRYGGEEFLTLLPGLSLQESEARVAELHRQICTEPIACAEVSLPVTCSFGVAFVTPEGGSAEEVVHAADQALYRAKANGRNRVEYAPSVPGSADGQTPLPADIDSL